MSASCVPCSIISPSRMQQMASAAWMVLRRWATTTTVMLLALMSSSSADWTMCSLSASKADVASSNSRMCGCRAKARAMAMRCAWPPESATPRSPTSVSRRCGRLSTNFHAWAMRRTRSTSAAVGAACPPWPFVAGVFLLGPPLCDPLVPSPSSA
mmetsp:Transcript_5858/g.24488  ORF Transcript_5858/g.24488 Transcript_5858/m.24488 type:complete len:155 (+) Transcript_5858:268-732(+)